MHFPQAICLAALLGMLVCGHVHATNEPGPSGYVEIELDGQGTVQQVHWGRELGAESEAIRRAMEARLRGLQWKVAAMNPSDRIVTSAMITTSFEPRGDKAVLQLSARYVGLTYRKLEPPRYPSRAIRNSDEADVLAKVTVDADGRPTDMSFQISADEPEHFEDSARNAISKWRFHPERINGVAVAGEVWVPIRYSLGCRTQADFAFTPQPLPGLVHVDGEATMADMLEITGWFTSGARKTPRECESS